jgi:hypothetical protein
MICHALKASGRPCHAYGSVLERGVDRDGTLVTTYSPTCRHHKHFFDGDAWKKKYLGSIWNRRELWQIPHRHIEHVLSSGAVEVTQDDIANISTVGSTWYLYVLLARHVPHFKTSWNPELLAVAQVMIWRRIDSIGPVTLTYADLGLMIGDEYAEEYIKCLYSFPSHARPELICEEWLSAACLLRMMGPGDEILTSPHLEKVLTCPFSMRSLPILDSLLADGTLAKQLLDARADLYAKCVRGVNLGAFREELLGVAWHPSRAMDWCMDFDGENPFKK